MVRIPAPHRIALAAMLSCQAQAQTPPSSPPPTADAGQLERVVITAEKRLTVLDQTPAAITALSGKRLAEQGNKDLADLVMLAPNTSFTTGQGASQLFVRGIGNVFILAGGDPGVALFSDGAYVSDQTSSNLGLFDAERVELLRGPQGALYGRNATGGAVNVISARPTRDFRARAEAVFGNAGRFDSEGFVSGGFGADQAVQGRLSYQVRKLEGYTQNPLAGQSFGPVLPAAANPEAGTTGPGRLDEVDSRAVRAQLGADVGAGHVRLIVARQRERDAGPSMPVLADPVTIPLLLFGAVPSGDPRQVESQGALNRVDLDQAQVMVELPVGSNTLHVGASWRKSAVERFWDSDTTEALNTSSHFTTGSTDRSLDVHLASGDSNGGQVLQWLIGASVLRFDQRQDIRVSTQLPLMFFVPGAPPNMPLPGGVEFLLGGRVRTKSTALYGDLRWALSPTLALLAGLRHNRDSKSADEYLNVAAFGLAGTGAPSDRWSSTPGSLGLEWLPGGDTLVYARLARGFKSGAVNLGALQPNLVRPETVMSAELGVKASFWDRRGAFSAAVFTSGYKDMQVSQVGQATVILANASKARIAGVELEAQLKPHADLNLGLGIGLMSPRYTDFTNTDQRNDPTRAVNVRGHQLAQVSKAQMLASAEWTPRLGDFKTSWRVEYVWRGRFFFTEFNTPDAMQEAYGLVNLSASIRPADSSRWKLFAYVRNAADRTALTSMSIASPLLGSARQVTYTPPRLVGVGASFQF